jgi:hypothetical protein
MNIIILKNNLREELKKYNYVLGSRLLIMYLNKLINIYSNDVISTELLEEFIHFLSSNQHNLENVKDGFSILCTINNLYIIIELLTFFNPSNYYQIRNEVCKNYI